MDRKKLNIELYRRMYLIRAAENAIRRDYMSDVMKTPMHMSTGEEAICAGVCFALDSGDQVLGTYRSHGVYLSKTLETDRFFAEMYGKATGMAKGKGGSMHLTSPEHGLICTSAIVGTTIPVAVGAAFANKQMRNGRIVAVFFGDGAIDEGVFWESLNVACVMKLPVIFVCEDNGYAVHSPASVRHGYDSIADIVNRFHCDVYKDETTDAERIWELTRKAAADVRGGGRPAFLYLKYYRYLEHVGVMEDFDAGYRPRSDFERWRKLDPVDTHRDKLMQMCGGNEIARIERELDDQVAESIRKAVSAEMPAAEELYRNVLA